MPFKCNRLYNSAGAAMLEMQQMPRAGGGGYGGASCGELYLLTRTFQNSRIHSRGSWWVAVKVQLMTIYIPAVVFSTLLCFNSISRQAGGWGYFPLISVAGRQRQADL